MVWTMTKRLSLNDMRPPNRALASIGSITRPRAHQRDAARLNSPNASPPRLGTSKASQWSIRPLALSRAPGGMRNSR